jgi:hypothetical protein
MTAVTVLALLVAVLALAYVAVDRAARARAWRRIAQERRRTAEIEVELTRTRSSR